MCTHLQVHACAPLESIFKGKREEGNLVLCLPWVVYNKSNDTSKPENANNVLHYQMEKE